MFRLSWIRAFIQTIITMLTMMQTLNKTSIVERYEVTQMDDKFLTALEIITTSYIAIRSLDVFLL